MPPKRFEGKFGIPSSHAVDSQLTSALYRLPESIGLEYINNLTKEISDRVNQRLETDADANEHTPRSLSENEIQTLTLKLARHFEDNGESAKIDASTCVDALIESPKFLNSDKGSMEKLFELHEMKTLQKIAELRRERAEITGSGEGESNPYENLFQTTSGKYYLARLLNMPHLEEESIYMDHCVGTSTSYVNKMKRGEVEILSFRDTATHDPLVTIEYHCKSHQLLQVKALHDRIPTLADNFADDLIEALERMGDTINGAGEKREVKSKEVEHLKTLLVLKEKIGAKEELSKDELLFLYEVHARIQCFDVTRDPLVDELVATRNRQEDIQTMCDCALEHIATEFTDLRESTQVFCEDTGTKITIIDFREEKNKIKLPQFIELANNLKESGSLARPDMSFEGGIVPFDLDREMLETLQSWKTVQKAFIHPHVWEDIIDVPLPLLLNPVFEVYVFSYSDDLETGKSSDAIIADMEKTGFRPATITELTVFGIMHPHLYEQEKSLVALGTKVYRDNDHIVPVIDWSGLSRSDLYAMRWTEEWDKSHCFVCVRKS